MNLILIQKGNRKKGQKGIDRNLCLYPITFIKHLKKRLSTLVQLRKEYLKFNEMGFEFDL